MIDSLSILFPVYNEAYRLDESFVKIEIFLKKNNFKKLQIIFIDDGSSDCSKELIKKYIYQKSLIFKKVSFKLICLKKNYGKGFALKQGFKIATNNWLLTTDIDHSVSLDEIILWNNRYINNDYNIYFGSRLIKGSKVKSIKIRNFFGSLFRILISLLFGTNILDTQCGFKLYKKKIGKKIFSKIHTKGFSHDIEVLIICLKNGYNIKELPVNWSHVSGSKLNLFYHPFSMFIELFKIYFNEKKRDFLSRKL